jgi:Xaa-Pro aminopeptidase
VVVRLEEQNVSVYSLRMRQLVDDIRFEHPMVSEGAVFLFGNYEEERYLFRQESSFYYFTGIQEPGTAAMIELNGSATLFLPQFGANRDHWIYSPYQLNQETISKFGFHELSVLGEPCTGYQSHPFFNKQDFSELLKRIENIIERGGKIFTLRPSASYGYVYQRLVVDRLIAFMPKLAHHIIDISEIVAQLRRSKDMHEIETMYKAVNITMLAHEAAIEAIGDDVPEYHVQAAIDYVYAASGAQHAFPSIIGSGKRSTTLHYNVNNGAMKNGDLVVVDIGAEYQYYAADLTRTYPVSGTYTARQKEIYQMVLDTQEYIASIAAPEYFLVSKKYQDKSLHHLAHKFLEKHGYDKYFPHSIGHFLGLEVHDVGNYDIPLQEGDVITIEPGLYIPEEGIGVRIEDNYWIVENGNVCLSEELPKKAEEIEAYMAEVKSSK